MVSSWPTNKHWPRSSAGKEDTEQQGRTARLLYNCPHDPSATPTHRASPTALLFRDDSCLKKMSGWSKTTAAGWSSEQRNMWTGIQSVLRKRWAVCGALWGDLWPVPLLIHYNYHTDYDSRRERAKTTNGKLISDYFANWILVKSMTGFSFSNVKDKGFSLSFVIVNWISLSFGQKLNSSPCVLGN